MKRTLLPILIILVILTCFAIQMPSWADGAPTISLTPTAGGMNTQVALTGSSFPAAQQIGVYLGVPGAGFGGSTYAQATTDGNGNFNVTFPVPGAWPNNDPILDPKLTVVAATLDGAVKASATFAFTPAPLDTLGWRTYSSAKFGFQFMLPPGW